MHNLCFRTKYIISFAQILYYFGFSSLSLGGFFAMNAKLDEHCVKIQFYLYEVCSLICIEFLNCFSYSL